MPEPSEDVNLPDFLVFCPRLPGESQDAYEAMSVWVKLGPTRTMSGLIRSLKKLWRSRSSIPGLYQIQEWQRAYRWEMRTDSYDAEARKLKESIAKERWDGEFGEMQETIIKLSQQMIKRAYDIALLPVVEKRTVNDSTGQVTIIKPIRASARDAAMILEQVSKILDRIRPRTELEQLLEFLGLHLQGMESGILPPDKCAKIAHHLSAMRADLEGDQPSDDGDRDEDEDS